MRSATSSSYPGRWPTPWRFVNHMGYMKMFRNVMGDRGFAAVAAVLVGVVFMPAANAQRGEVGGEVLTECITFFGQTGPVEECPSQTGPSTRDQFFEFVSNLGTRISQQRHVVRNSQTNSGDSDDDSDTMAFRPVLGGAASADSDESGITQYGRLSTFGIADYTESDRERTSSGQPYEQETESAIFGADYRFSDSTFGGATLNYLSGETDFTDVSGNPSGAVDVDSYVLGLHGSKYWANDVFVEGLVTYGDFELDTERRDGFTGEYYDGSPDGELASADVTLGYVHSHKGSRFTPAVKLLYLDGSIDSYSETSRSGLGDAARTFEKQDFDALNLEVSVQVDRAVLMGWGVLIPSLKLAYQYEFKDPHRVESVVFGTPLFDKTESPDKNVFVVRPGLAAQFTRGWSAFVSYERLFEHRYIDRDNFVLGVRYEFF